MADITIKTLEPKETLPLIQDAMELEKRLISDSISKTKDRLNEISTSLGIRFEDFEASKVEYTEDNEASLLRLEGELEILKRLETQLNRLNSLQICA